MRYGGGVGVWDRGGRRGEDFGKLDGVEGGCEK